jgi:type VI secretion system secreted protein VgrG
MFVPDKNSLPHQATDAAHIAANAVDAAKQAIENKISGQTDKVKNAIQKAQHPAQVAASRFGAASALHNIPSINDHFSSLPNIESFDTNDAMAAADILGIIHAVNIHIVIGGTVYQHFNAFQLQQSVSQHHSFKLVLPYDILGTAQDHTIEEARDFLGQSILVTFKYKNVPQGGPERNFKGIITQVGFAQQNGSLGDIVLTGKSPTALLDAALHTQSFGGETSISLQSLAEEVIQQGISDQQMNVLVKCAFKGNLLYTCQYNETHYNYLARMAAAFGEWFYYDGETLHFGKPPLPNPIKLIYGKDTRQVQLEMRAAHINRQHYGYNSKTHQSLSSGQTQISGLGELGSHAYTTGKRLFKTKSLQVSPIRAIADQDIEITQKGDIGAAAANMFTLTGNTSVPFLFPGCLIEMNFRRPDSNDVQYFSRMLITQVNHYLDAKGNYQCNFEAIPSDTQHLPQPCYNTPIPEPQIATVTNNADSQGRVKVKFDWQVNGDTTDFIRVMTSDAGSSNAVNKNRGSVFIPEVGDQVMIGFQHHHPDRPYVMGSLFHGKIGEGGGSGNDIKSIKTRSGHTIELNDNGSGTHIIIKDPGGNTIHLDTVGKNITITAPETITLNATNIVMNASEDITGTAGKNVSVSAGENISNSANENITSVAGTDIIQSAAGNIKETSDNRTEMVEKDFTRQTDNFNTQASRISLFSEKENMTIQSGKTVEQNSAEKSTAF